MLYSEEALRANIRNREGKRVFYLGKQDQLTSAARDWTLRERIEILPADQAAPDHYRLLSGGTLQQKPEHLTHLNGNVLVPKTHPRIRFRGKLDTLEAELLLCQQAVPAKEKELGEILSFSRMIIRCDVLEEAVPEGKLCGLTQEELRSRSHRPQDYYGQTHFMPEIADGETILRLNLCRCAAREAELAAAAAFTDANGALLRADILRALNRMSSMLYILMIQCKG